jgi:hypothetical protein
MENVYVWEATITKTGDSTILDKLFFFGTNFLNVSHVIAAYVYGDEEHDAMYNDFGVDVVGIKKCEGVGKIINASFNMDEMDDDEYDIDPFDVSSESPDDRIAIKHTCGERLELLSHGWGVVKCPKCSEFIARSEISNLNGIWVFIKNDNRRK